MVANITFLSFLLFSMCHSIHVAVNTWLNCSFFTLIDYILASSGSIITEFDVLDLSDHYPVNTVKCNLKLPNFN